MKKIIILGFVGIIGVLLGFDWVQAIDIPSVEHAIRDEISTTSGIPIYDQGADNAEGLLVLIDVILAAIKYLVAPILVIFIIWSGVELMMASNDEQISEKKDMILGIGIGFAILMLAVVLVENVFFGTEGQILRVDDSTAFAQMGNHELEGIFSFLAGFAFAIAMLFLAVSVLQLAFSSGDEEALGKIKNRILYSVIGLIILGIAYYIYKQVYMAGVSSVDKGHGFFGTELVKKIIEIAMVFINYILTFVAILAVIAIIWAGVRLVANFGNDDDMQKSKDIIKYAIFALVLAISMYAIILFFVDPSYGVTVAT